MEKIIIQDNCLVHFDRGYMARVHLMDEDDVISANKLEGKGINEEFFKHEIKAEVVLNRSFLLRLLASMEYEDFIKIYVGGERDMVILSGEENFAFIMPVEYVSCLSVQEMKDSVKSDTSTKEG